MHSSHAHALPNFGLEIRYASRATIDLGISSQTFRRGGLGISIVAQWKHEPSTWDERHIWFRMTGTVELLQYVKSA